MPDRQTRVRQVQRTALKQLATLLIGNVSGVRSLGILAGQGPDPGLFGPLSITWKVVREPLLLLAGGRALLMQLAHPLVAQGVADHSNLERDPFGRLLGTVCWLANFVFGARTDALTAVEGLRVLHEPVRGRLSFENSTALHRAGIAYSAADPTLGLWVYATLVESMLTTYRSLIAALSETDADRFVREWADAGQLLGLALMPEWESAAALQSYVARAIADEMLVPGPVARSIAQAVLRPPLPWPGLAPASHLLGWLTTGLIDAQLRRRYRLPWTQLDQRFHGLASSLARASHHCLPRRLRVSPLHDLACSRLRIDAEVNRNLRRR